MVDENLIQFLKKYYYRERTASDMNLEEYEALVNEKNTATALAKKMDTERFDLLLYYQIILFDVITYKRKNDYFRVVRNFATGTQDIEDLGSLISDISHL